MDVQNNSIKITNPTFPANVELSNDKRKSFVLNGEHQRKWIAENPNNHIGIRLKIDGALITTSQQNKCDNGLLIDDNRLYLIEFKGKDYTTAARQLVETKKFFKENYSDYHLNFHARIIGKSFPRAQTENQIARKFLQTNFTDVRLFETNKKEQI